MRADRSSPPILRGTCSGWLLFPVVLFAILVIPAVGHCEDTINGKLVLRGREEAEMLWRRGYTLADETLDSRLPTLLTELTSQRTIDPGIQLQVKVLRSPDLNAFALPDGSIFLFAGLLSRLNSWGQVCFILGHEAEHAIEWHAQKHASQARIKIAVFQVLSVTSTVVAARSGGSNVDLADSFAQLGLSLTASAMVTDYGRDLEGQSDRASVTMMRQAGHDECASLGALQVLLDEKEDPNRLANAIWGSHPLVRDRLRSIEEILDDPCPADSIVEAAYAPIKWKMTKLSAELWLEGGQHEKALGEAHRYLAQFPEDPEVHCILGEAYSASSSADSLGLAEDSFEAALSFAEADYRLPLRGLALVAEKRGDATAVIEYLERYLSGGERVPQRRSLRRKLETLRAQQGAIAGESFPEPAPSAPLHDSDTEK